MEFAAALMNHHAGMYDKRTHLEDARRRGVRALLPDVNRSRDTFTADGEGIRIGLERVRGLSLTAREAILAGRARRPFAGPEDLASRVALARPELEALVLAGAFDFAGRTRPEMLCAVASGFDLFRRSGRERSSGGDLFEDAAPVRAPWATPPLPEFSPVERLWLEWHVLGLCVDGHPMEAFRAEPGGLPRGTVPVADAERVRGRRVAAAGIVAARRTVPTRQGRRMQFVTLEDETGMIECTLFPDAYERHRGVVRDLGPYAVTGRIEEQHGAPTLNVERLVKVALPPTLARLLAGSVPMLEEGAGGGSGRGGTGSEASATA